MTAQNLYSSAPLATTAGSSVSRVDHTSLLMTSIATLTGLVQIALKLGAGRETRSSTTLAALGALPPQTLVMPGLFTYIAWMNRAIAKFLSRFNSPLAPARLLD